MSGPRTSVRRDLRRGRSLGTRGRVFAVRVFLRDKSRAPVWSGAQTLVRRDVRPPPCTRRLAMRRMINLNVGPTPMSSDPPDGTELPPRSRPPGGIGLRRLIETKRADTAPLDPVMI